MLARSNYRQSLESERRGHGAAALGSVGQCTGRPWAQPVAGVRGQPETGGGSQESGGLGGSGGEAEALEGCPSGGARRSLW